MAESLHGTLFLMQIRVEPLPLVKRYPLTISRGTSSGSSNLKITVTHDDIMGFGEFTPVSQTTPVETHETATAQLTEIQPLLEAISPWEFQAIEEATEPMGRAAFCALEMALHDWVGKYWGVPVYQLLGGDKRRIVPTSVTIGILPPDEAQERVLEYLSRLRPRSLKIKLGSPAGIEADKALLSAVRAVTPADVSLRVDANGGWQTIAEAQAMLHWLAGQGVEYVEQPLHHSRDTELPALFVGRPLPLFADESCRLPADVARLAGCVDGVNLKLMKAGGIRAGLRLIHTAKAHELSVMMGCFGESSLAIAASVALSPYADFLDLDSHLNLNPDPFTGLLWSEGRVLPNDTPGLGVTSATPIASHEIKDK
jgi:L-alanine-DL-glutamate epimerase-like enolase superfamily enzyme